MNVIERFKALPIKTKSLLGIGIVVALVVALPLFIWGIINLTYDIRERASTGELPSCIQDVHTFSFYPVNVVSTNPVRLDYLIYAKNNDSETCNPSTYTLEVIPPTGWTGQFSMNSFTLAPGVAVANN